MPSSDPPFICPRCGRALERFTVEDGRTITACPGCGQYDDAVCTCTDDTVCANCAECIEIEHVGGWWPDDE
jgi:hypothetical protein